MDTEVDQRTAAGLLPVIEPGPHRRAGTGIEIIGSKTGNSATAEPDAPGVVNIAERAFFDHRLHRAGLRIEPVREVDSELFTTAFRGIQHLLRFLRVHCHRFFAKNIRSGFQPRNRQRIVLIVRNGNRKNVEFLIPDHVNAFGIDLSMKFRPALRKKRAAVLAPVRNGNDFHIRMSQITGQMPAAHAEPDNTGFQLCSHLPAPQFSLLLISSSGSTFAQPDGRLTRAAVQCAALTRTF